MTDASALIMTILLDTAKSESKLGQAMEWETAFVEFMLKWTEDEKPEFMDIAFYSSRSLQDELHRSSFGDMGVIRKRDQH